ncbi:MAG TPA: TadE/TadG family type IV pilus assembly protein [Phenylobacterium sp.]|jgi:Flp pilus assembly protein TadG|nr:TadE/TadG family type IV pilus assembly protein [Phenylobacterium sp.]
MSRRSLRRWRMAAARLRHGEDGAAVVEFAFVLPLFLLLMAGLFDGARLVNASLQVHAAAQAGAAWAQVNGWNSAGIASAVSAATPLPVEATPAPVLFVGCAKQQGLTPPGPNGHCPGNQPQGSFVTVGAQAPFAPLMPWPRVVWPASLNATAVVRIQ